MEKQLFEILACPLCKGKLIYKQDSQELICLADKLAFSIKDNIPVMIQEEARKISAEEYADLKK